jgi:hypothetical protein
MVTLFMTDTWGDGWNGNTWTATSNTGGASFGPFTLVSGSSGSENFCLPNDCYNIVCDFGGFQAEVGWLLIEDATGNTLASGGAPFSGQCSVGGIICTVYGCMDSTAINYNSNANVDDGSCAFCISTLPYFEDFESGLANEIILIDSTGSTSTIDSVKNNNWSWHGQGNTGVGWGSSYNTGSASFNSSPSHIAKGILCVDLTAFYGVGIELSFDLRQESSLKCYQTQRMPFAICDGLLLNDAEPVLYEDPHPTPVLP